MARYRSIPTEIDAWQFKPYEPQDIPEWISPAWFHQEIIRKPDRNEKGAHVLVVPTNHGPVTAQDGDWIIRNETGEVYPCVDEIFRKKYVRADQPHPTEERLVHQMVKLVPYEERWFNDRELGEQLGYKIQATYKLHIRW